ncbi:MULTISPECIES: enoyl-CoA hydratase/isomerase family protein [Desulfurella]|uniref:enoyl-CoA hydratase/isomerase family protein n=1 Tax=Desulfurella TaxID=33001 RepID=UPI000CBB4593|nr:MULTISPECIES: enoyl-CoA hydratase-related protein [Desulfurella]PMP63841.1 MAG: enoyl-CoA hydratase [Desulfurella multipotens]PMP89749.1 MAG: enoyl-CoA hydratase [Desulfurella sp.]PMP90323.1 MAG: enoyl-CoA hydratase [Desulfurella sp.]PMP92594.1 MAG: enoyl-CoA hydratase [Desulfurella sp.]
MNILFESQNGTGYITINRPDKLNALNIDTINELKETILKVDQDKTIKCVIITGSGEKAFVAGADIEYMQKLTPNQALEFARLGQETLHLMETSGKPFIACVNGYALGGGFEVALSCDIILAQSNAKFGFPEVGLGIIPGFGGTQNLSRLIGKSLAKELIFSAKMIDASKAKELGIVSEVYQSKEELLQAGKALSEQIQKNAPLAIALAKRAIVDGYNLTKEDGLRYEASLFGVVFSSNDAKEGLSAFVEKRKPNYTGG